jgi:Flp pilus assembly protein TadD
MRIWIAAAVGSLATFMTAAAFEWVWEMGAIACVVMALAAVILAGRDESEPAEDVARPRRSLLPRLGLAAVAAVAIGAVAVPMAGALATRDSRDAAKDGQVTAALQDSRTAERLQPYAATPHLQRALVLEQDGRLPAAAAAARAATRDEPTNWRPWFTLARIDARRGENTAALRALRKARTLNPRSPLLAATK